MPSMPFSLLSLFVCMLASSVAHMSPLSPTPTWKRFDATPSFPPQPPSCPICEQHFPSISSCAEASYVFANISQILFAPTEFISAIKCACTDTFQSAFPQCVDCFQQTNQTDVLDTSSDNLPAIVSNIRSVCAIASTLLGNVTNTNGEQVGGTPSPVPMAAGSVGVNVPSHSVLLLNLAIAGFLAVAGSTALLV